MWITNPCQEPLRVETFDIPPDRIASSGYEPNKTVTVPPLEVVKVRDAFTNAAGKSWSARFPDLDVTIPVDGGRLLRDTIVVPATICRK